MKSRLFLILFILLIPWGSCCNICASINNCNYWKASEETMVAAETTLINDDMLTAKIAFTTTLIESQKEFVGEAFTHYIQVRVNNMPTTDKPNGTEMLGSSPIILTVKKDLTLKIYYRRQSTSQNEDGGVYASNDGRDLKIVNQAMPATYLNGTLTIVEETEDFKYAWVTKEYDLAKGNTYTLCGRGTTIQLFGMAYEMIENPSVNIGGIYYNLNQEKKEAEVTRNGINEQHYCGTIVIPTTVEHNGTSYSVTSIGHYAFSGCSSLTSVTIPNSVTSIGEYAFQSCLGLNSITIPNSVKSIGRMAFYGCLGLTSMTIPDSVVFIGSMAFYGCSGIISVTMSNSIISIGNSAFYKCTGINSVYITDIAAWCNVSFSDTYSNPLTYAHHLILNGEEVENLVIPNSVKSIGDWVFEGCTCFTSVTIPSSLTFIGSNAFSECSNLSSIYITDIAAWCQLKNGGKQLLNSFCHLYINEKDMITLKNLIIPDNLTSIQSGAFNYCSGLTSITIGRDVTSVGSEAFYECSDIISVTIGSGVKTIGSKAFANYSNLTEVYCFAKEIPTTDLDIFENSYVKYATLYVPESSLNLYKRSEPWSQFGSFVGLPEGNDDNKCEKPVITLLANGKIKVESATEGATCVTNITASNAEPLSDGEISLNTPLTVYTITSYAMKEGYDDSEVATATFRYEKAEGDINGDGNLNISDVVHLVNMILGQ